MAANDLTVKGVLARIFKTIEPHAVVPGASPLGGNICHGKVADKIIQRNNNPEDKIWLYGDKSKPTDLVRHSVLSDENNRVLRDPWDGNPSGFIWQRHEGYGKPGDMMDYLGVYSVGDLYDQFG